MQRKIVIAKKQEFSEGATKTFSFGVHPAIAVKKQGIVKAYINRCTHMGGPVERAGNVFRCRWHQAEYDPETGMVLSGQAPAGTMLAPIDVLENDQEYYALFELPPDPFA
jgi:nitrite reductase/ring-hydroxylating ferredoxin subunit